MAVPVATLREDHARVRRLVARAEGELAAVEARKRVLDAEVGVAKGRIALKPKVDSFLEELQAEAHHKRVGDFEKLLTAVVQEVLPGEFPIGLDLGIERGQPSLDIVSRRRLDQPEDIYEDQGGALTNVISMGLRVIAAVRSNTRRFLVLDEGDCWIATDRVPSFYKVLSDAATKLSVQCFAISHHDIESFGGSISVARLRGDKDRGAVIENTPRRYRWQPGEEGIASIRLRSFQSFIDETIHLTPGVNALVGPNNLGKSALVRALRAVFHGECRDSLIRHGERGCIVDVAFANGRTLRWDRVRGRNPVNVWKLLGQDGAVVTEGGMTYETGGRTSPEWVSNLFGIGPVEGLDVHIVRQKNPVFLLDKSGSTRAAVLSIGQESGHIRTMIQTWKEECAADATKVRDGEREMSRLKDRLDRFAALPEMRERVEGMGELVELVDRRRVEIEHLEALLTLLDRARSKLATATDRKSALDAVPSAGLLKGLEREAEQVEKLQSVADRASGTKAALTRHLEIGSGVASLPRAEPRLLYGDTLGNAATAIIEGTKRLGIGRSRNSALAQVPEATPALQPADHMQALSDRWQAAAAKTAQGAALARGLASLPAGVPVIDTDATTSFARVAGQIECSSEVLFALRARFQALRELPSSAPGVEVADPLVAAMERIGTSSERLVTAKAVHGALADLKSMPVVDASATASLERAAERIALGTDAIARLGSAGDALSELPASLPDVLASEPIIRAGFDIREGRRELAGLKLAAVTLARLTDTLPSLVGTESLSRVSEKVQGARQGLAERREAAKLDAADLEAADSELRAALADMGNACPVCGCTISDPDKLLHAHAFRAEEVSDAA